MGVPPAKRAICRLGDQRLTIRSEGDEIDAMFVSRRQLARHEMARLRVEDAHQRASQGRNQLAVGRESRPGRQAIERVRKATAFLSSGRIPQDDAFLPTEGRRYFAIRG